MFTCDAFGAHYCTDDAFDTELEALAPHYRFYYDCLMCAWPPCSHSLLLPTAHAQGTCGSCGELCAASWSLELAYPGIGEVFAWDTSPPVDIG